MCVVSMVFDHYRPKLPAWPQRDYTWDQAKRDKQWIENLKEAVKAAKKVDELTAQPDCEDPEKAKLLEKVERLEKVIDQLLAKLEAKNAG